MNTALLPEFTAAVLFLSTAARPDYSAPDSEPIRIGVQREAGHRLATTHGLGIVKEFVEIGAPATSLRRRPVLRRVLAYLEQHPDIRVAIFPAPHRFSRDSAAVQHLRERFQRLGVQTLADTPRPSPPAKPPATQ
ncbi:recombinase family protein [Nocardia colli]|uniref:recombinase family protein n=1 Tax=Nocardia colli TaxID=2545717 RepID=UPI0035D97A64